MGFKREKESGNNVLWGRIKVFRFNSARGDVKNGDDVFFCRCSRLMVATFNADNLLRNTPES